MLVSVQHWMGDHVTGGMVVLAVLVAGWAAWRFLWLNKEKRRRTTQRERLRRDHWGWG